VAAGRQPRRKRAVFAVGLKEDVFDRVGGPDSVELFERAVDGPAGEFRFAVARDEELPVAAAAGFEREAAPRSGGEFGFGDAEGPRPVAEFQPDAPGLARVEQGDGEGRVSLQAGEGGQLRRFLAGDEFAGAACDGGSVGEQRLGRSERQRNPVAGQSLPGSRDGFERDRRRRGGEHRSAE